MIHAPNGILEFDLDFRNDALRRVFLHIPHPIAGFFMKQEARYTAVEQIDEGFNFMLCVIFCGEYNLMAGSHARLWPRLRCSAFHCTGGSSSDSCGKIQRHHRHQRDHKQQLRYENAIG
ncbi:hypothetical protein F5B18DRAFT_656783 [Nemania serpens]|nr:hypothetical protein F5B18DRAFT_656783 [Nemania serpens]